MLANHEFCHRLKGLLVAILIQVSSLQSRATTNTHPKSWYITLIFFHSYHKLNMWHQSVTKALYVLILISAQLSTPAQADATIKFTRISENCKKNQELLNRATNEAFKTIASATAALQDSTANVGRINRLMRVLFKSDYVTRNGDQTPTARDQGVQVIRGKFLPLKFSSERVLHKC